VAALFGEATAFRTTVQISGSAHRIARHVLKREFENSDVLRRLLLQYANALLIQVAQTAVCNKFHSVEARFCRWLLMAYDRSVSEAMEITHDILARTLGTRRATVTIVAGHLQRSGAIRYSRGLVTILDRKVLQSRVCECYEIIAHAHSVVRE
jgi:CRP-like cAMP-binding protein